MFGGILITTPKTHKEAFYGNQISVLMREDRKLTKAWLFAEVGKVCKFIDANKTLKTEEDFIFTTEALLEYAKSWTAEEFMLFFTKIKRGDYGKTYERLKTPEFLEYAKIFESQRTPLYEQRAEELKKIEPKKPFKVSYTPEKKTLGDRVKENINVQEHLSKMSDAGLLTLEEIERLKNQER